MTEELFGSADIAEIVEQKKLEPDTFSYYVHYVDCKQMHFVLGACFVLPF